MSLIGKVGRKRPRARFAMFVLYIILILGAATTVYPFMLMLSTGFKGPTDQNDNKLIPQYWSIMDTKDSSGKLMPESLLGKYLNDKYAGDQSMIDSTRIGRIETPETLRAYESFLLKLPPEYYAAGFRAPAGQVTSRLTMGYPNWLRDRYHDIDALNKAYIDENADFRTLIPAAELLDRRVWKRPDTRKYREWLVFKAALPAEYRIPVRGQRMFQEFLRSKFQNQMDDVPKDVVGLATKFEEILLPASGPLVDEFRAKALPPRYARATVEDLWRKVHPGPMPVDAYEHSFAQSHAGEIRREFSGRNYRFVIDYMALNGRALWNTVIFCLLAILTQLTVNPLAAYALSRYPIRASAKILLFLLATMAFPAEVAMIPSFLLLKQFGLLNTFAALVLP